MPAHGDLATMSLAALLQWIATGEKTGRLCITRGNVSTRIYCRDGFIIGCYSDSASTLLGQFLISLGKIDEETLQLAIEEHDDTGKMLGQILVEYGTITHEELDGYNAAKAEQTIYDLFDWEDASYRFDDDLTPDPSLTHVRLEVTGILMEGLRRADEMKHMRAEMGGADAVLRLNAAASDGQHSAATMANRILDRVNDRNTLNEILRDSQSSEYFALRFLHSLHEAGQIETSRARDEEETEAPSQTASADADASETAAPGASPDDSSTGQTGFFEMTHRWDLPASGVPVAIESRETRDDLSPTETFVLDLMDGRDVRSIVWLASLREAQVLDTLKDMIERGIVALEEPATACNDVEASR